MKKTFFFFTNLVILLCLFSCTGNPDNKDRVLIAISGDVTTLNPMYTVNYTEGVITEQIYLRLVDQIWDSKKGTLATYPMLAKKWKWNSDSTSITLFLRDDVTWQDSVRFTASDVVYTFGLYSDPSVNSRFVGSFNNYFLNDDFSINLDQSFKIVNDYEVKINFRPDSNPGFFDFDMPILPKHILEKYTKTELATADFNFNPVGTGPYKLKSWQRNQSITLTACDQSFLKDEDMINEIIFSVIPDYNSQLFQLQGGDIDFMQGLRVENVPEVQNRNSLQVSRVEGRQYDYIGWNNIDPQVFSDKGKLVPNKLFGNKNVRKALTYAINRNAIIDELLKEYGRIATGPVSSIFKDLVEDNITPYSYDSGKALELLNAEGWTDSDKDGLLDKHGVTFSFSLNYPSGNPLREFASNIIQSDLAKIGIEVKIAPVESSVFFQNMFGKTYDAWISGWLVPIPVDLKPYWYSDLEESFPNVVSYQNKDADLLLEKMQERLSSVEKKKLYTEFLELLHNEQPVTFLYWKDDIVAYNKRIKGVEVTPLGAINHCWEWKINN